MEPYIRAGGGPLCERHHDPGKRGHSLKGQGEADQADPDFIPMEV